MLDQAKPRAFVAGPSLLPSQDVPVHLPAALARTAQAHPDNGIILLKAGQEDFLSYQLLYDAARSYARQLVKAAPQGGYCVLQFADAKAYFIATRLNSGHGTMFWCQYLSGKEQWASKPDIAIQFNGTPAFVAEMRKQAVSVVAVEVPDDADKRWKAR